MPEFGTFGVASREDVQLLDSTLFQGQRVTLLDAAENSLRSLTKLHCLRSSNARHTRLGHTADFSFSCGIWIWATAQSYLSLPS